jgi:peptide deformylase
MMEQIEKDLTIMEIMIYGCPVLKEKAARVTDITDDVIRLAQDMVFTMQAAPGIGLAAPQVNRSLRLITIDLSVGEKSVPEVNEKVTRPARAVIQGTTLDGNDFALEARDLLARVFCHEIDHLNGKLFIEHLSPLKQRLIKQKFKKMRESGGAD